MRSSLTPHLRKRSVGDGGAELRLDVAANDGEASLFEALGKVRGARDEDRDAMHERNAAELQPGYHSAQIRKYPFLQGKCHSAPRREQWRGAAIWVADLRLSAETGARLDTPRPAAGPQHRYALISQDFSLPARPAGTSLAGSGESLLRTIHH